MKICYVADAKSPHTQRWIQHFSEQGHEVALLSYNSPAGSTGLERIRFYTLGKAAGQNGENPSSKGSSPDQARLPKRLFRIAYGRLPENVRLLGSLESCVGMAKRLVGEFNPDLVHGHFLTTHGYIAARVGYRPLIVSAWGSDVLIRPQRSLLVQTLLRYTVRTADLVTSNSATLTHGMVHRGIKPSKIATFPWGIDSSLFYPRERSEQETGSFYNIYCPRTLNPVYNIGLLIRAIPELLRFVPNVRVFLSGIGPLRGELESLARGLNVDPYVAFLGWQSDEEIARRYRESDVYVSTSLSDSTSVSLLEAMASGVFPVVTDLPGNREWIRDGENGFLVPVNDPLILADRIARACRDSELRFSAAQKNAVIIKERGEWATSARRMEECYQFVLSRKGAAYELNE